MEGYWDKAPIFERLRRVYRREGALGAVWSALRALGRPLRDNILQVWFSLSPAAQFRFRDKTYRYFRDKYNSTWRNERAVELPIAWEAVRESSGRVLEVGHVLGHYFPIRHEVLDKYENAPGVRREDVVGFRPTERYDLIVSVSTLEHVGWDEEPKDPAKFLRAVEALRAALAPGGMLLVTLPVGWNPTVDEALRAGLPGGPEVGYIRKTHPGVWEEDAAAEALRCAYDRSMPSAVAVAVAVWRS